MCSFECFKHAAQVLWKKVSHRILVLSANFQVFTGTLVFTQRNESLVSGEKCVNFVMSGQIEGTRCACRWCQMRSHKATWRCRRISNNFSKLCREKLNEPSSELVMLFIVKAETIWDGLDILDTAFEFNIQQIVKRLGCPFNLGNWGRNIQWSILESIQNSIRQFYQRLQK